MEDLKILPKPYSWNHCMLEMAFTIRKMSKDPRTKIGAVIVSPDRSSISFGYNGFPKKVPDYEKWWNNPDHPEEDFTKYELVIHAEINAITQARQTVKDWSLYLTVSPCLACAKRIVSEEIAAVYYCYKQDGIVMDVQFEKVKKLFEITGIKFEQIPEGELNLP